MIDAYIAGLEDRLKAGKPVDRIASVASFFVSRVDTEIDKRLDALAAKASGAEQAKILALRGKAAVANAQLAYKLFLEEFSTPRWAPLAAAGARLQRPALGEHELEESRLSRRHVRRAADRPGHGEHHAARDDRGVPRSW